MPVFVKLILSLLHRLFPTERRMASDFPNGRLDLMLLKTNKAYSLCTSQ